MNIKRTLMVVVVSALFSSVTAWAANDGTVGSTSTGDLDITLTMPNLVRISGFTDIPISYVAGSGNTGVTEGTDDLCVYRNAAGGAFAITATGDGGTLNGGTAGSGGTAFEVANTVAAAAYTVTFTDATPTDIALTTGNQNATALGAHETDPTCGGSTNTSVKVTFQNSALAALPSGTYDGRLTLTVAPQ